MLSFYQQRAGEYAQKAEKIQSRRNLISILRVITFIGFFWLGYLYFSSGHTWYFLTGSIGSFIGFLALAVWDSKIMERIALLKALRQCCVTETAYLNGNYESLAKGEEFSDPKHPYSSDLDIFGEDSLFQHINRTFGKESERMLAEWLLHPCRSEETIKERLLATEELSNHIDLLLLFRAQAKVSEIDQFDRATFSRWEKQTPFFHHKTAKWFIYAANCISIAAWLLAIFSVIPYSLALTFFILQMMSVFLSLKKINQYHERLGAFMKSFSKYLSLLEILYPQQFRSKELADIHRQLFEGPHNALKAFRSLNHLLHAFDQRGNVMVSILTNGFYTSDFHLITELDKWNEKYKGFLSQWMEAIYRTDVLMSMAGYRVNHPSYTEPISDDSVWFEAKEMGHPLLPEEACVCNDFSVRQVHELYIVTGANMAGKSTFLRTVGINFVLALSGNVVCCQSCRFQIVQIFSSMRTSDNLAKGSSYFHAEIQRLKSLVDTAEHAERLFIILDEILKGTNSHDKLNGSRLFLQRLLNLPVSGLIATHDLALGELHEHQPEHFTNICFEIENTPTGITYDYRLKPGISQNMNASILLEQLGLI
ncbi:MAG: DNA mismatch repair protein MutS [Bacteroidales bacterium]|nr:DNA mismatch repair protein MutS [Bacteroidales bacterium]